MRSWKDHNVGGMRSTDKKFPIKLWDRFTNQQEMALNIIRPCIWKSKISAYMVLEGTFDFNRIPFATPHTKIIIHENPVQKQMFTTWCRWLVPRPSPITLQVLDSIRQQHPRQANCRQSGFFISCQNELPINSRTGKKCSNKPQQCTGQPNLWSALCTHGQNPTGCNHGYQQNFLTNLCQRQNQRQCDKKSSRLRGWNHKWCRRHHLQGWNK